MNCEMNLTDGFPASHDARAEWRATNAHGAPFYLCDSCVTAYKQKNVGWESRGVHFVKLSEILPPVLHRTYQP